MIDEAGLAKVTDFGIALAPFKLAQTVGSVVKGTPYYMAPEQWRSREGLGPATDLFALGCILWEMACGRLLYRADSIPALLDRLRQDDPAQEAAEADAAVAGLGPLVQRLLARAPSERPASALEVEAALVELRDQHPGGEGLRTFCRLWRNWRPGGTRAISLSSQPGAVPLPEGPSWQPWLRALGSSGHPQVPAGSGAPGRVVAPTASLDPDLTEVVQAPEAGRPDTLPVETWHPTTPKPSTPGTRPAWRALAMGAGTLLLLTVALLLSLGRLAGRAPTEAPVSDPDPVGATEENPANTPPQEEPPPEEEPSAEELPPPPEEEPDPRQDEPDSHQEEAGASEPPPQVVERPVAAACHQVTRILRTPAGDVRRAGREVDINSPGLCLPAGSHSFTLDPRQGGPERTVTVQIPADLDQDGYLQLRFH